MAWSDWHTLARYGRPSVGEPWRLKPRRAAWSPRWRARRSHRKAIAGSSRCTARPQAPKARGELEQLPPVRHLLVGGDQHHIASGVGKVVLILRALLALGA